MEFFKKFPKYGLPKSIIINEKKEICEFFG